MASYLDRQAGCDLEIDLLHLALAFEDRHSDVVLHETQSTQVEIAEGGHFTVENASSRGKAAPVDANAVSTEAEEATAAAAPRRSLRVVRVGRFRQRSALLGGGRAASAVPAPLRPRTYVRYVRVSIGFGRGLPGAAEANRLRTRQWQANSAKVLFSLRLECVADRCGTVRFSL